jgi:hypothetical protein
MKNLDDYEILVNKYMVNFYAKKTVLELKNKHSFKYSPHKVPELKSLNRVDALKEVHI